MSRFRAIAAACALVVPARAAAQWCVTAEVGLARFGGTSLDTAAADPTSLRPSRPTLVALRLGRDLGAIGFALAVARAPTGLLETGPDLAIVVPDVMTLYEVAPEVAVRVARSSAGATWRLHAGPVLDHWTVKQDGDRTRWGVHVGSSLGFPLVSRLGVSVRAGATLTPSVFDAAELPDGFERRAMWRTGIALGVRYSL